MDLKEFLLLTLLNTIVCLALPRMLSWLRSFKTQQVQQLSDEEIVAPQPDLSNI